jgi:signal peptidase II
LEERLKKYLQDYAVLLGAAGVIIFLDQWSKAWVRNTLAIGEAWMPWEWLRPYARAFHTTNTGVAFGMFQGANTVLMVLAILVSLAIVAYFPRVPRTDWTLRMAMCLQLGGALGNLIDRVMQGYVTDFISVGKFAVFNLADSAITVGVFVLLLGVWLQDRQERRRLLVERSAELENGG